MKRRDNKKNLDIFIKICKVNKRKISDAGLKLNRNGWYKLKFKKKKNVGTQYYQNLSSYKVSLKDIMYIYASNLICQRSCLHSDSFHINIIWIWLLCESSKQIIRIIWDCFKINLTSELVLSHHFSFFLAFYLNFGDCFKRKTV